MTDSLKARSWLKPVCLVQRSAATWYCAAFISPRRCNNDGSRYGTLEIVGVIIIIIFLTFGILKSRRSLKIEIEYKIGYDHQPVQSVAGKLSCKRTALKRCTKIEILWYRKLVSQAYYYY